MNAAATLDRSIEDLAAQCGVDAQAAEQMSDTSVRAALTHYTDSMRRCAEQAAADPSQIIALLMASK